MLPHTTLSPRRLWLRLWLRLCCACAALVLGAALVIFPGLKQRGGAGAAPGPSSGAFPCLFHWETQELRLAAWGRGMKFLRFPMEKTREGTRIRSWRGCCPFDSVSNRYNPHLVDVAPSFFLHSFLCDSSAGHALTRRLRSQAAKPCGHVPGQPGSPTRQQ